METSRIIVKNIPTVITEKQLRDHFSKMGEVTDVKVIFKNQKNRRFCFIGYKLPEQARKAKEYFNNTYINTSKVQVDLAQTKDSQDLPVPNSKYSKGSIQYNRLHGLKNDNNSNQRRQNNAEEKGQDKIEEEELTEEQKKEKEKIELVKENKLKKFKEFQELMKVGSVSTMSWNDVVGENTGKKNSNKKKKQKQQEKAQQKQEENYQSLEQYEKELQQQKELQQKEEEKKDTSKKIQIEEKINQDKNISEKKVVDEKRLYVLNLPYNIGDDEVRQVFQKYGQIDELKLPKGKGGSFLGYAFVTYNLAEEALHAFSELDNKIVFGRILHIRPSYQDSKNQEKLTFKDKKDDIEVDKEKSSYKKLKKMEMRKKLKDETNWNTLFLNPNTILESISSKFQLQKSEILSLEADDLAVRVANAETQVINETKKWMLDQGLNLDFLDSNREECERSKNIILAKNLAYNVTEDDIRELFSYYGIVQRVLLCPNKSISLIEYHDEQNAENGFQNLQYKPFKRNPIYLEWAPLGILDNQMKGDQEHEKKHNQAQTQENNDENDNEKKLNCILYVKNLNYSTTEQSLKQFMNNANVGDIRSVKIVKKKDGTSYGYGFVEFNQPESVINSIKSLQNKILDGHSLQLSFSKKEKQEENNQKKKKQRNTNIEEGTKLIVRNVAFEATKKDIRQLFKTYGELKAVRMPKKLNGQHRGFGFVEFVSTEEAKNAFTSLENTHLYGRKLVIEWAKPDENQMNEIDKAD